MKYRIRNRKTGDFVVEPVSYLKVLKYFDSLKETCIDQCFYEIVSLEQIEKEKIKEGSDGKPIQSNWENVKAQTQNPEIPQIFAMGRR